ncbi:MULTISPECIES: thiolase family protein [Bacillaceae]|uniref:acetyl-CoA C-acetyltransferase n=1 Tax=Cytobacillus firmus TaxID=1399 RepID=A0AA46P7F1_CYTFI|nr:MULTISPECIES: thiolase family protein [Bacillaceae]MBG9443252.1 acetyl-CoA acetyltransferase [Cytobacillus firmus]MBG9449867.1 acetyl-CoA acetyltransferase [Cytobacillus firmus]MCC3645248.1 thiolase family protein [Cytobacillus oceanisediminis]MCS0651810.1 thiolase family protein [Cytobacillus firmus]MCU1804983.1 thiolase family protein [Cytobacillus firmus]
MRNVVITSAVRTPVGIFGGAFKDLLPTDLIVPVLKEAAERSGLQSGDVNEVILGHCIQRTDEPNTARTAALLAGFDDTTTGFTVQRQCASGMQAIISAALQIASGMSDIVIAGGVEAMSSSPYVLKQHRWGARMQHGQVTDTVWEILEDPIHHIMMGETAENLAEIHSITREEQDEVALLSHKRALHAIENGYFDSQIVPITVKTRKGEVTVAKDENPRADLSAEKLSSLKPVFRKGGTVTAGNSSSLNDGGAALVLMPEELALERGLKPLAKIAGFSVAGVDPKVMGRGPVPAVKNGLASVNWSLEEADLIEVNEAFAAQYLAVERELGLNREKVNVNGSGISLGHPIGCTGARLVVSLVHELKRRGGHKGIASLCVGGGMGATVFVETYE